MGDWVIEEMAGEEMKDVDERLVGAGHTVTLASLPIMKTMLAGLEELAHSTEMRHAASALGEQIRTENSVNNAVRQIEETFL